MNQDQIQELQMLEYQFKQLQQVLETLDGQLLQLNEIQTGLVEFEKITEAKEALFPLANGIYAKGTLSTDKMLIVNIGNNITAEKTVAETLMMLDAQKKELEEYRVQLTAQMDTFMHQLQESQGE